MKNFYDYDDLECVVTTQWVMMKTTPEFHALVVNAIVSELQRHLDKSVWVQVQTANRIFAKRVELTCFDVNVFGLNKSNAQHLV